jgi:hypothetical protein
VSVERFHLRRGEFAAQAVSVERLRLRRGDGDDTFGI